MSEITNLFADWQAKDAAWKASANADGELDDALLADVYDVIERMLAAPCADLTDLAAKLVALCDWVDEGCFCYQYSKAILAEAGQIMLATGVHGRTLTIRGTAA